MAPLQGQWGVSNTGASQQQGPPQGLLTPASSQRNANNTNPNVINSAARSIPAPTTAPGAQYVVPSLQSQPSYGMSPNTHPSTIWPLQQAIFNSGPVAVRSRHKTNEVLGLEMVPPTPATSGLPQSVPNNGVLNNVVPSQQPSYQPPYQGYPPNVGTGPLQQMGTSWMQSSQHFQRPPFMHYSGSYPGTFQGQIRRLGSLSNGMLVGPSDVAPGFVMSGQAAQRPVMWAQGPSGASPGRPTVLTAADPANRTTIATSAGSVFPLEKEPKVSGIKTENGPSQAPVDPGNFWTAHKTDKGAIYYFNSVTTESTYTRPEGFKGEAAKVTTQPTPVSWERMSSTDWALVITDDEKKYYHNTKTQASCWEVPPEVAELCKKQEEIASKSVVDIASTGISTLDKSPVSFTLNVPNTTTGGQEAIGHKAVSNSALDLIKKKLQDSGAPVMVSPIIEIALGVATTINGAAPVDVSNGKGFGIEGAKEKLHRVVHESSEESSESEEEDPEPTKEQKVNEFKEMLKEKGVAPFSKWEKELPKIIFDPRFKAMPSHTERRTIFEHYVRTRADVERREKRAAQKAAIEGYKQLLEEASKDISHTTTYDDFAKKWGQDTRFETLERKDRESLFSDRVGPLRKTQDEKVRAERAAAVAGFRSLLSEKGEISSVSRWSKVKENLQADPRFKIVQREEREELFNAIIGELRAVELEVERSAKAKKDEEGKLREKEREARKRKEREEHELERVRVKARRKDASSAYQALLTEKIKDPETSWAEAWPKLERDSLGRASNPDVDVAQRERIFWVHVDGLYSRCVRDFRSLLSDLITPEVAAKQSDEGKSLLSSWHEAKKILKPDLRYSKISRRERELLWRKHVEDMQRRTKGTNLTSRDDHHLSANGRALAPPRVSSDYVTQSRPPGKRIRR